MKRALYIFSAIMIAVMLAFNPSVSHAASDIAPAPEMKDFCVVPPYVVQNIPPNIMMLVDISGSMFEFAHQCFETTTIDPPGGPLTSASWVSEVYVANPAGFRVGDYIAIWDSFHGTAAPKNRWLGCYTSCPSGPDSGGRIQITAIDQGTQKMTLSRGVHYKAGVQVVKETCTDFTDFYINTQYFDNGYLTTKKYYGYFNADYWYTSNASGFDPTAPKTGSGLTGARARVAASEWDGNFLNWLTMRRFDVVRKVLTGGQFTGTTSANKRLKAELADSTTRGYGPGGYLRSVPNAGNYIPTTLSPTNEKRCFSFSSGVSGTSKFSVSTTTADCDAAAYTGSYTVAPKPTSSVIEGVLQSVVSDRARVGLMFYNTSEGGKVTRSVGFASLTSVINDINNTRPTTWTPLGESLWSAVGYFSQVSKFTVAPATSTGPGGNGPMYYNADYGTNATNDPMNFGTGGSASYPQCQKNFVLLITDGEPCSDGNLPAGIKDYAQGKSNYNCGAPNGATYCPAVGSFGAQSIATCGATVSAGIEDVALFAHTNDLRSASLGTADIPGTQNLTIYTVFAFGKGSTLLRYAAINGGFEDGNANNIPDVQAEWDNNGDNEPDTFYEADDGQELENGIRGALSNMLMRASSGTAASVLASREGKGANIIQAVFYPRRRIGNDIISWVGSMQNLWYLLDPKFRCNGIFEDTDGVEADNRIKFELGVDRMAQLYFDQTLQAARANIFTTNSVGCPTSLAENIALEDVRNLWEAGKALFSRNIWNTATADYDPRTIYMSSLVNTAGYVYNPDSLTADQGLIKLTNTVASTNSNVQKYMNLDPATAGNAAKAERTARYLHGYDVYYDGDLDGSNDYRSRTVQIGDTTEVWKLGDILNSTPKILTDGAGEYKRYKLPIDLGGYADDKYIAYETRQKTSYDKKIVFAGSNEGLIHAFNLGKVEYSWAGKTGVELARIENTLTPVSTSTLGREEWAFIPKQAMAFLQYMSDLDYCHIYTVDLTPYIFDATIAIDADTDDNGFPDQPVECTAANYQNCVKSVDSWRTIMIGGMRIGGACRARTADCSLAGDDNAACVNAAANIGTAGQPVYIGMSSYFALDITNPYRPKLLWEFPDYANPSGGAISTGVDTMGYATSGPMIVKINGLDSGGNQSQARNGKWFAVFGSGPTGGIDEGEHQFLGKSDQQLRLFVIDLRTGQLLRIMDKLADNTIISEAFSGSLYQSTLDIDGPTYGDYSDDAAVFGYTRKCTIADTNCTVNTWTSGGILRLKTFMSLDPNQWKLSKVIDGIGSVTSAVAKLYDKNKDQLWFFFGEGRYFYRTINSSGSSIGDDYPNRRRIWGIKEQAFGTRAGYATSTLTTSIAPTDAGLADATTAEPSSVDKGWYIWMDPDNTVCAAGASCGAERVITDAYASDSGILFVTSFLPYKDECSIGGKSYLWAIDPSTGWVPTGLKGFALIQLSTGAIEQVDLSTAFGGGRKSASLEGVPPTGQGFTIFQGPPANPRILQIIER